MCRVSPVSGAGCDRQMQGMILIKYIFTSLVLFIVCGCASSVPPILNANMPGRANCSIVYNGLINKDTYDQNGLIWTDTLSSVFSSYKNNIQVYPYSMGISISFLKRFEIGSGLLGLYQKILLLKPKKYDKPALSNIAVSEFSGWGFSMLASHLGEEKKSGGVLIGLPLTDGISITSGIYYQISSNYIDQFMNPDLWNNLNHAAIDLKQEKLVIPVNCIINEHAKSFSFQMLFGFEFPYYLKKDYEMNLTYKINDQYVNEKRNMVYLSNHDFLIKLGVGISIP
jgi:hypothetical protein